MNPILARVTQRVIERSKPTREPFIQQMESQFRTEVTRSGMGCGNLAHGFAGCSAQEKERLRTEEQPNLAIVTAYNDMLSAHKPYETYPPKLRDWALEAGAVAQVAGGVPAMCDGITQGADGMELSLFSRDAIAMGTAVALSHNMFDGTMLLGICDKIVPGMLMGALPFGHLPTLFIPGGPMPTGISNEEKSKIRQDFAEGKIDRAALLKGESDSYHSPGTCTFYGTANSNQMLLEMMGLQLPGSSFVNPGTEHRELLSRFAVRQLIENIRNHRKERSLAYILDEKAILNAIIGLLATGGSTNHTIHLIAIARAAGVVVDWTDFSELSEIIPLMARVYPNGVADVNHFHAAGGVPFIMQSLLKNGLMHQDVNTILGPGLDQFCRESGIENSEITWRTAPEKSYNESVLRPVENPFQPSGGIRLLKGNLGRSVIKTSAVEPEHWLVEAPAIVFESQEAFLNAFKANELNKDFIAVLPFQGPGSNGMPELHKLTPSLTILQKRGFRVALVTDGRMSGASGKVPAAIHLWPEAKQGGNIARIQTGDVLRLDARSGTLDVLSPNFDERDVQWIDRKFVGCGRELFAQPKSNVTHAELGASFLI